MACAAKGANHSLQEWQQKTRHYLDDEGELGCYGNNNMKGTITKVENEREAISLEHPLQCGSTTYTHTKYALNRINAPLTSTLVNSAAVYFVNK